MKYLPIKISSPNEPSQCDGFSMASDLKNPRTTRKAAELTTVGSCSSIAWSCFIHMIYENKLISTNSIWHHLRLCNLPELHDFHELDMASKFQDMPGQERVTPTYVYICVYVCLCAYIAMYIHVYIYIHIYVYTYTYVYYMYVYIYIYMCVYICVHAYMYTYVYTCVYMHTYT